MDAPHLGTGAKPVAFGEAVVPLREVFISVSILRSTHEMRLDLQCLLYIDVGVSGCGCGLRRGESIFFFEEEMESGAFVDGQTDTTRKPETKL